MANKGQAYKIGQIQGQTQEKAGGIMGGARNQAEGVKDKAFETGQVAKDKVTGTPPPQNATDKVGGLLQATGEKTKGAACGAGDAVKNTIGMGGTNDGVKDKAFGTGQVAKDKVTGATQATQEKSSDTTKAVGDQATGTKKNTGGAMDAAKEKMSGTPPPQTATDKVGGLFQATGEKTKGAVLGAGDAVKNTVGMGGTNNGSKQI